MSVSSGRSGASKVTAPSRLAERGSAKLQQWPGAGSSGTGSLQAPGSRWRAEEEPAEPTVETVGEGGSSPSLRTPHSPADPTPVPTWQGEHSRPEAGPTGYHRAPQVPAHLSPGPPRVEAAEAMWGRAPPRAPGSREGGVPRREEHPTTLAVEVLDPAQDYAKAGQLASRGWPVGAAHGGQCPGQGPTHRPRHRPCSRCI